MKANIQKVSCHNKKTTNQEEDRFVFYIASIGSFLLALIVILI